MNLFFYWQGRKFVRKLANQLQAVPYLAGMVKNLRRQTGMQREYQQWLRDHEMVSKEETTWCIRELGKIPGRPLISVVMPVYNAEPSWLCEAIDSVLAQTYIEWELCIADDASDLKHVEEILSRYERIDHRIHVIRRKTRGHISAASNTALEMVTGSFVAFLDHDDRLAPDALLWTAYAIIRCPEVKLIYSDEDKIDLSGKQIDPYFKCDFNRELFYGQNLVSHLGVFESRLVKALGGFRTGFEGSQDYDLAIRCLERIGDHEIVHIPKTLYHWRMHEDSTAMNSEKKPYAYEAAVRSLNEHFEKAQLNLKVEPMIRGLYRVRFAIPRQPYPLISIIIPFDGSLKKKYRFFQAMILKTRYENLEWLLMCRHGNNDLDARENEWLLEKHMHVHVLTGTSWVADSLHLGVLKARGSLLCFLNNDLIPLNDEWLSEMAAITLQESTGATGAKLLNKDGSVSHAGYFLGRGPVAGDAFNGLNHESYGYYGRAKLVQEMSAVSADCMMIKRERYLSSGGFNTSESPSRYFDIDLCLRLKNEGFRNIYTPWAELIWTRPGRVRISDRVSKNSVVEKETIRMFEKWGDLLAFDPSYNINLSLTGKEFSLSTSPRKWNMEKRNSLECGHL